jgi:hypothetical protein
MSDKKHNPYLQLCPLNHLPPDALPVMRVLLEIVEQGMDGSVETARGGNATAGKHIPQCITDGGG